MKYSTAIVGAFALCVSEVVAFPAAAIEYAAKAERDARTNEELESAIASFEKTRRAVGFDAAAHGNDYKVIIKQFEQMFALQPDAATANYDLSVLTPFRADRFQQSVSENPYFFNGAFTGVAVQPAAYTFIYRFMGNKSAEYPEGRLDQETLKSFFSVTGTPGNFKWTEGYEKIPDNWYKRAIGDEYTIPFFLTDLLAAAAQYPKFLSIGGNTGTVNSFTGVDPADLTGGVFNADTLLEGNNAVCYIFQLAEQMAPDVLKGILTDVTRPMDMLTQGITQVLKPYNCPVLQDIDKSQFAQFPGAKGAY
ncbi:hypothetical protein M7I_3295 [Glarea lozoyensis 74030]|uniref:Heme haloperoxidase family profile domain-containing protein n=1 Tax=Glarea lozoyensis (strain ATCC 74030 / MF5533) TaxID=1104152 RepID=H0EKP0_GLAL7|nr:hypothetical protein M7I_3295 [Glarea lozoyensis 74030]